jgi:hypothetical protein
VIDDPPPPKVAYHAVAVAAPRVRWAVLIVRNQAHSQYRDTSDDIEDAEAVATQKFNEGATISARRRVVAGGVPVKGSTFSTPSG